jgi:RNA polymerase sigma factor (sigma-70 family)
MAEDAEFERIVDLHYAALYRFALSLCRHESDAGDLVQQTFYVWAAKGHQLKDRSKVKSWLFTTLHREYLQKSSRLTRFPQVDLEQVEPELPRIDPGAAKVADASTLLDALGNIDPVFRAPVALFYLEEYTYPEIADVLQVPLGTVKSRIYRGLAQLQRLLAPPLDRLEAVAGGKTP